MVRSTATAFVALALSACSVVPVVPTARGDASTAARANSSSRNRPSAVATTNPAVGAQQCLAKLGQSGSTFSPVPDQYTGNGCSIINAVRMTALGGDVASVRIGEIGPVACPVASAFADWARFGVDRAARQMLGSGLARIDTMGTYTCRDIAGTGRRSAHSRAEAIDIGAFVLEDGRRISVIDDWSGGSPQEREFLRTVHRSACKRFNTVLGPNYNTAHLDHFHLEESSIPQGTGYLAGSAFCR